MQTSKVRGLVLFTIAWLLIAGICLLGQGFATEKPIFSSDGLVVGDGQGIRMTDNGLLKVLTTGTVNRGTAFYYASPSPSILYGQWLYLFVRTNQTDVPGNCTQYTNLTVNVTINYENVPVTIKTAYRYPYTYGMCLNTTTGVSGFYGAIGGGHAFFPLTYSSPSSPCSFNNLDGGIAANDTIACESYGYDNSLPDGSAILNLTLWNYNSGEVYDFKSIRFIEGCETGCVTRPTVKVLDLNPSFTANVSDWRVTHGGGTAGSFNWSATRTDSDGITKTGIGNYTILTSGGVGGSVNIFSSAFMANRTSVSMLISGNWYSHLSRPSGYSGWGANLTAESDNTTNLLTLVATTDADGTPDDGLTDWQTLGVFFPPESLTAQGINQSYKLQIGAHAAGTTPDTYLSVGFDELKAKQYIPSIAYELSTYAQEYFTLAGSTGILETTYSFSQCSEYSTDYICFTSVKQGDTVIAVSDARAWTCTPTSEIPGAAIPFLQYVPGLLGEPLAAGTYNVTTECDVNGDPAQGSYISSPVSVEVLTRGSSVPTSPGSFPAASDDTGINKWYNFFLVNNLALTIGLILTLCVFAFLITALPEYPIVGIIAGAFCLIVVLLLTIPKAVIILIAIIILLAIIFGVRILSGG